jgi:hypothetical protein
MTLQEALAIARDAQPKRGRIPMDKLQRGSNSLAQHVAGVDALAKSYSAMGGTLSGMTAQLAKVAADIVLLENHPSPPWRPLQ